MNRARAALGRDSQIALEQTAVPMIAHGMGSRLIAADAVINLSLGALLLLYPPSVVQWLGLAGPSSAFFPRILGGVICGIGVSLVIEYRRRAESSFVGLGVGGAIAINLCGGGVLVAYLVIGDLSFSRAGTIALWALAAAVVGLGAIELFWQVPRRPTADDERTIVFRSSDGRTLTMEDLRGYTGKVDYQIIGSTDVPAAAVELHARARQTGSKGDYERALDDLAEASRLAPDWPYPVYDAAFSRLLMGDFAEARAAYERTVELAPRGFFTAITAAHTLGRESRGELPQGTYKAYVSHEWIAGPDKVKLLRELVRRCPDFSAAWLALSQFLESDSEQLDAIEKGMAGVSDRETSGKLRITKAIISSKRGDGETARRILADLALDPGSTLAVEHLAKATLALMSQ